MRSGCVIITLLGLAIYLLFASVAIVPGWSQTPGIHDSVWSEVAYVIQDIVFFPGLPPLMVSIYFLMLQKTPQAWKRGLLLTAIFVPIHYVVAVWMAHGSPAVYVPMMVLEFVAALGVIVRWRQQKATRDIP